ncbi:MAG: VOC family protein [Chitinophagaceae bacterium]
MPIQVSPYLGFNGKCREAMTYYHECFGGDLTFMTVAETPVAAQCPSGIQDHIMHSMLANGAFVLMATDMSRPDIVTEGAGTAISLNFDTEADIRVCYEKLAAGGKVLDPLQNSFWGSLFGVLADKYGKVWLLNYDKQKH